MDDQKNTTPGAPPQNATPVVPPIEPLPADFLPVQPDYLHPIVDPPKHVYHPKRVLVGLTAAVIVSLLIVGILVAYAVMPQRQQSKATTTKKDTTKTVDTLTAEQTLKNLGTVLKDGKPAQQAIALPVMAPKKSFYTVIPDVAPVQGSVSVVDNTKLEAQLKAVAGSFEKSKFTSQTGRELADPAGYLEYYTRADVICQVTVSLEIKTEKTRNLEVDCLDMTLYTEYAATQQPFVSVYTPATSSSQLFAFTGKPVVAASKSAGYQLSDIPVSTVISQRLTSFGTVAAFYQTPDGLWHYFLDHDSSVVVDCAKFNSNFLLYAYAGQSCAKSNAAGQNIILAPKTKK